MTWKHFSEVSTIDATEETRVTAFYDSTCKCTLFNGRPCSTAFTIQHCKVIRNQCLALDRSSLDMLLMGHIMSSVPTSDGYSSRIPEFYTKFHHHGIRVSRYSYYKSTVQLIITFTQVCMTTFLFLHGIGKGRLDNVKQSYQCFGIEERIHGNAKRLPHNGFTTDELKAIVSFLVNYAEENAILLPGRIPGFKQLDLQLLPTETTWKSVWMAYMKACATLTFRVAAYPSFCKIWNKYTPHIMITTPKTDLCWTCQQNSFAIASSSNKSDSEKQRVNYTEIHVPK